MALNKKHPKCKEYTEKFWKIIAEEKEAMEQIDWTGYEPGGLDGNPQDDIRGITAKRIKKLQQEYDYLFDKEE